MNQIRENYKTPQPTFGRPLDMIELEAYIDLFYLLRIIKSNHRML